MERKFHMDEFESFLRDKADQYKLYPSDKVWGNINKSLHPRKKWPYVAMALLLVGVGISVDYSLFNFTNSNSQNLTLKHGTVSPEKNNIAGGNLAPILSSTLAAPSSGKEKIATIPARLSTREPVTDIAGTGIEESQVVVSEPSLNEELHSPTREIISLDRKSLTEFRMPAVLPKPGNITENTVENKSSRKSLWAVFPKKSKLEWQVYFSPTASYRKLTGGVSDVTYFSNNAPFNGNQQDASEVSKAVTQKPSFGAEIGTSLAYKLSDHFRLKAGIQFNYTRYQLRAYNFTPEKASFGIQHNGYFADTINVISNYRNYDGYGSTWLQNQYLQVSIPIGFEWSIVGNKKFHWNIASTIQPTYNLTNNAYMLSTDFQHYGQDPSLVRKWNINAGVETFISYNMGPVTWRVGPQFRYQLISSYQKNYPIKEYLLDYGFKIGISKTLR
jgi:hypothetical protein